MATISAAPSDALATPLLDAEAHGLLQRISEQGGYAYVGMSALAAAGDSRAAEAAREMAWEQLHSGPWHSVLPVWRDAYSMACLHVAKFHYSNGDFKETLRVLDMGLIMGGLALRKDLESAIETASQRARASWGSEKAVEGSGKAKRDVVRHEPKIAEVRFNCKTTKSDKPMYTSSILADKQLLKNEAKTSKKFNTELEEPFLVLQVLPKKSLSCKIVEKRSALSFEGFLRDYFLPGSPVILSDCMAHWPARTMWNDMDYLKKVAGCRTIPVEVIIAFHQEEVAGYLFPAKSKDPVGKNYLCTEWKQELITFSEFLERIQSNDSNSTVPTYLAQHPLFDQACISSNAMLYGGSLVAPRALYDVLPAIEELRRDIVTPDYCFAGDGELRPLNAWFGPAGTVTPLHHDPHHNILAQANSKEELSTLRIRSPRLESLAEEMRWPLAACNTKEVIDKEKNFEESSPERRRQEKNTKKKKKVVGKKYIRLYPAALSEELYPHTESMLSNSSQVDLDNIDEKEYPEVQDLEFVDCILEEGEMLYIPPRWWHYVRSLTTSFSVSFWWTACESSPAS
ncbi:hypothetical protein RJ639_047559 [Escallonia herrerae]|uniref:JmjC domain-containing protein n=1 Tax=Escallonia herrerae TaxID=1293975 RepID=A0AA88WD06_9ASTE|nr:hypothetical protein RJ639_047559 [Escallonia herrerae]